MDFSSIINRNKLKSHTAVALTPLGRDAAEKSEGFTRKAEILSALEEGPQTIKEIAAATNMSTMVIINNCNEMIKSGKIRIAKGDM